MDTVAENGGTARTEPFDDFYRWLEEEGCRGIISVMTPEEADGSVTVHSAALGGVDDIADSLCAMADSFDDPDERLVYMYAVIAAGGAMLGMLSDEAGADVDTAPLGKAAGARRKRGRRPGKGRRQ